MRQTFTVATEAEQQCVDVTAEVREAVARAGVSDGLCLVMVLHSTAAIAVNESADPNIGSDLIRALGAAVPTRNDWLHDRIDDNAHSHIKAALLGPSELVPVSGGELVLGSWQSILLLEFDGPRKRQVCVQLLGA